MIFSFLKKSKVVLALFFLLTLSACNNFVDPTEDANSPEGQNETQDSGKDDLLLEKLGYYSECINRYSNPVFDSLDRYLGWVDAETGPTGQEANIVLNTILDPSLCVDAVAKAKALKVAAELDTPADAFLASLQAIYPLLEEGNKYYAQGDYKDDAMAKGKELHPRLMAAFEAFEKADTDLRASTKVLQSDLDDRLLDQYKADGSMFEYVVQNALVKADTLVNLGGVTEYTDIELEAFTAAIQAYEASLDDLDAYVMENKDDASSLSSFQSASRDYLTEAKELMRRKRDNVAYQETELMTLGDGAVKGSPARFIEKYNGMISMANSIR